jgi:hypothetical protein
MSKPAPAPTRSRVAQVIEASQKLSPAARRTGYRRLSSKDRAFVSLYVQGGCLDPIKAASDAGFSRAGMGLKLRDRLRDLIDNERIRLAAAEQMELDEALRRVGILARDADDDKVKLASLRTILQVHGVLSDKPMPSSDRSGLRRQLEELVQTVKTAKLSGVRVKAMLAVSAENESEPEPDQEPESEPVSVIS